MAEVAWTSPAIYDLNDIAEYIALSVFCVARNLTQKIFDKISRLEDHPESGQRPQELINFNYYEVITKSCRIFYKVDSDKVYILHVMHQERDLRRLLLQS